MYNKPLNQAICTSGVYKFLSLEQTVCTLEIQYIKYTFPTSSLFVPPVYVYFILGVGRSNPLYMYILPLVYMYRLYLMYMFISPLKQTVCTQVYLYFSLEVGPCTSGVCIFLYMEQTVLNPLCMYIFTPGTDSLNIWYTYVFFPNQKTVCFSGIHMYNIPLKQTICISGVCIFIQEQTVCTTGMSISSPQVGFSTFGICILSLEQTL